ncbi:MULTISPECIES: helix-turn-helix domain-containing protein [unclassified Streptomyces]|uniref:RICIN domain-containing protein n=1 Tax=unclassified Streptomyces TaxID=2593676 RepID=UPI00136CDEDF|nr:MULTISPECIES: helix-turn-helix domain-containing protein [unclassified Streptomyces]MYY83636.1 XRE family transcriptional regulator [Streptomyces sp. SID335]MYZ19393.1 XRE family transcriptional regulator [Streptomyces sp. SID337]NDZ99072.1 helix-turn-helix domain-containing protein [Streptomyces sp. SID10116]NEB43748.1 helix-turn-helix domain-containing protein [Streptomyces sp. SID339]
MGNSGDLPSNEEVSPHRARDVAGFIAAMRELKKRSGLTYRELEERAACRGDVLARSTLADVLRRTSLPRPEVVAAFVHACGDGDRADAWLAARDRIASARPTAGPAADRGAVVDMTWVKASPVEVRSPAGEARSHAGDVRSRAAKAWSRRAKGAAAGAATALAVPMLALIAWGLLADDADDSDEPTASASAPGGWVTIRPARTADLCLTDGRDRAGAYESAVAVQLRCAKAPVPRTYLEPRGEDLYRIQWHHPEMGKGCLAVMGEKQIKGMLEPRRDCEHATVFRLEPDDGAFRLRPATGDRCIGIVDDDTAVGAEAIEEPCSGAADQRFLVRPG